MEYVKGWDIAKIANRLREQGREWPADLACWIAAEICAALKAAQEHRDENGQLKPIVHRDVSPENVFISVDGAVKLGDFGVAKVLEQNSYTEPGALKGKLGYIAPERLNAGSNTVDGRIDIYSVGVILHECLSGARLFLRDEPGRTLYAIIEHKVPRLSALRRDVPTDLDDVLSRALAKSPDARYQTAAAMRHDLDLLLARMGRAVSPQILAMWLNELFEGAGGSTDLHGSTTIVTDMSSIRRD
jgi:serine/threonine protein kinase